MTTTSSNNLLGDLMAAQTAARPAAPAPTPVAPPAPVAPAVRYYVLINDVPTLLDAAAARTACAGNPGMLVAAEGSTEWVPAASLGLSAAASPTVPVPPPAAAPVAPAAPVAATTPFVAMAPATPVAPAMTTPPVVASPAAVSVPATGGSFAVATLRAIAPRRMASLAEAAAEAEGHGGGSHSHPWATLKDKNWESTDTVLKAPGGDVLPSGGRPFSAIYLSHRVGAVGWNGGGGTRGDNNAAPKWRFVLGSDPNSEEDQGRLLQSTKALATAAANVQFCPKAKRGAFDDVGHLKPEVQILCWGMTPGWAGVFILIVTGQSSFARQLEDISKFEATSGPGAAATFTATATPEKNGRAQKEYDELLRSGTATKEQLDDARKRTSWDTFHVALSACTDTRFDATARHFESLIANDRDREEIQRLMVEFTRGDDFKDGCSQAEIDAIMAKYAAIGRVK